MFPVVMVGVIVEVVVIAVVVAVVVVIVGNGSGSADNIVEVAISSANCVLLVHIPSLLHCNDHRNNYPHQPSIYMYISIEYPTTSTDSSQYLSYPRFHLPLSPSMML